MTSNRTIYTTQISHSCLLDTLCASGHGTNANGAGLRHDDLSIGDGHIHMLLYEYHTGSV